MTDIVDQPILHRADMLARGRTPKLIAAEVDRGSLTRVWSGADVAAPPGNDGDRYRLKVRAAAERMGNKRGGRRVHVCRLGGRRSRDRGIWPTHWGWKALDEPDRLRTRLRDALGPRGLLVPQ
ncbi:hypothetical protein [Tsukamurella soli]|uniref:Uncharacterized protein n=1 Tax=Tsukamurella soli TaxID=644556 RepID=A0ABP8JDI4_9ACTN